MTSEELNKILDDKTRILTTAEIKNILRALQDECLKGARDTDRYDNAKIGYAIFYEAEANAFRIALKLLEHAL